jgi:hypothetical protein
MVVPDPTATKHDQRHGGGVVLERDADQLRGTSFSAGDLIAPASLRVSAMVASVAR